jgi:hypothetical protein
MKIVRTFVENLYSFHYPDQSENELKRVLSLWNDSEYLELFFEENRNDLNGLSFDRFSKQILHDANQIDDKLYELSGKRSSNFDVFFKPLHNQEYQAQLLSKRKGRVNYLRLYALKVDTNFYVITGGAIKFTHLMEDRKHTDIESDKLEKCRRFLNENGVYDSESFFEFLIENL